MTSFSLKLLFLTLFCCTVVGTTHAQVKVRFDLVIIFKPTVLWGDIVDTRTRLGAVQLDSTLPSGAKFWRCSIDSGTTLSIPNAFGTRTSGIVNQPSDAVGVICNGGTSDGVSLNGLYVIPEGTMLTEGSTAVPPFFQTCTTTATDSITTVPAGQRALKIAILDSGIDCDTAKNNFTNIHTAIAPYLCYGRDSLDGKDSDRNGYIDDFFGFDFVNNTGIPKDSTGHGTFVTGVVTRILAKNTSNNVKIFILKVLNAQNRGYEYDIIRAIDYALKMKVEVINCSFISSTALTDTSDLPLTSAIATAQKSGVLVSIAAGNNGKDIDQSNNLFGAAVFQNPNIIVTGATSCLDSTASFSNFAKRNVDLMTPGKNIGSTWIRSSVCTANCYAYYSGTSFAAPQTTAVAAILSSNLTGPDWQKVKCTILKSATNRSFLINRNRRSATLNGLAAFGRLTLTNTPCDDIINSTGNILENITTFKASPNPFSTTVNVEFSLKKSVNVQISVFNSTGQRLVNQSVMGISGENNYPLSIEATAGVYIVQIQAGSDVVNQKIVKL